MEELDLDALLGDSAQEQVAEEQQQEERSVASTLFQKLRAALSGVSSGASEAGEASPAEVPPEVSLSDADGQQEAEDVSDEQAEAEASAPLFEHPSDEEIQAAAKAVTQAIREASKVTGVELSDDRVLEFALTVFGQANSLEQAELLAYGLIAREAQRQGLGVRASRTREFEQGTEDTLDMFIRLVSG